ncbi:Acetyltransferase (GNAT) domain-containing protein [Prauserella aidingensis]|uniref:GNAT family N-acetyltransferase n=1 Tax=Prauserella aidingensis TaxID=387890 RepID=UPI0020A2C195|nr:GNAT family N-acetyltransferase [Prauserella aidingensis]MCP2251676.1 Acetyltransferase (GNAT) domain-containing protein [Prauserella aidingensis]
MNESTIRTARDDELPLLAGMRWRWVIDRGDEPTTTRDEFAAAFVSWARAHTDTHHPLVVVLADEVIGMAWLALQPRVPSPRSTDRMVGDLQCVYVEPEHRSAGHGDRLIEAVLARARELDLEWVTVHSSERAVTAYERRSFAVSPRLLQATP